MAANLFQDYAAGIRRLDLERGKPRIHPMAIIADGAKIGADVNVGPFSVIGPEVVLKEGVWIDSHVTISGRTTIGAKTRVWPFATLGVIPQDLKFSDEPGELHIGELNMIREYCNFSIGTTSGGMKTRVGNANLFMVHSHVGHDSEVGDSCIFANGVSLAGHVRIENAALLMGHSAVHQFCSVGELALVAGGAMVTQDVPPFVMVHGNRAKENGLNLIGIKRAGYSVDELNQIKTMHKFLYRDSLTIEDAATRMRAELPDSRMLQHFIAFVSRSERGICR